MIRLVHHSRGLLFWKLQYYEPQKKVKFESQKYCSPSKQMPTEKCTLLMKVNTQAATFSYNIIYHGTLGLILAAQECAVFSWCARKCDAYSHCGLQVLFKIYMSFKQHSTSALADTQEKYPLSLQGSQRPLLFLWFIFWFFLCWEERPQIRFLNFFLLSSCLFPLEQNIPTTGRNLGFPFKCLSLFVAM